MFGLLNRLLVNVLFVCIFILPSCTVLSSENFSVVCNGKNIPACFRDESGNITGVDVEIIRELSKRLNLNLDITLVPWKRVLFNVMHGLNQAGMPLFLTQERQEYALYTDVPVHHSLMTVFTSLDNDFEFKQLSGLYGRIVGIRRGFSISPEFDKAVQDGLIEINEVNNVDQLIQLVKFNRVDVIIDKRATVGYYLNLSETRLKNIGKIGEARAAYLVISKKAEGKDPNALLMRVNATLKEMAEDGTINKITRQFYD